MNAIVTVVGQDKVGIIAAICILLSGYNVNILDISQTILQGAFTMVMAVDVSKSTATIGELGTALAEREDGFVHPHPAGGDLRRHAPHLKGRRDHAQSKGDPLYH